MLFCLCTICIWCLFRCRVNYRIACVWNQLWISSDVSRRTWLRHTWQKWLTLWVGFFIGGALFLCFNPRLLTFAKIFWRGLTSHWKWCAMTLLTRIFCFASTIVMAIPTDHPTQISFFLILKMDFSHQVPLSVFRVSSCDVYFYYSSNLVLNL